VRSNPPSRPIGARPARRPPPRRPPPADALLRWRFTFPTLVELLPQGSLVDDVSQIMTAPVVVYGQGTFVPMLLSLSPNIKEYYHPNWASPVAQLPPSSTAIEHQVDITRYWQTVHPWMATPQQLRHLLEWPRLEWTD